MSRRIPLTEIKPLPCAIGSGRTQRRLSPISPTPSVPPLEGYVSTDVLEVGIEPEERERRLIQYLRGSGTFTVADFARLTGISTSSLYAARNAGTLKMLRIAKRGWRIPVSSAVDFLSR